MRKTASIAAFTAITCGALVLTACGSSTTESAQPNRDAGEASGALSNFAGWNGDAAQVVEWNYSAGNHPGFECYHDVTKDGETTTSFTFRSRIAPSTALPMSSADLTEAVRGPIDSNATWKYWPAADSGLERDRHALRMVANTDGVRSWRGSRVVSSAVAERQLFGPSTSSSNPAYRCATADFNQFFVVPDPSAKRAEDANSEWRLTSGTLPWQGAEAQWAVGATFQLQSRINPELCALSMGTVIHSACARSATTFKVASFDNGVRLQDATDPSSCLGYIRKSALTAKMVDCADAPPLSYDSSTGFIRETEENKIVPEKDPNDRKRYLSFKNVNNLDTDDEDELAWYPQAIDIDSFTLRSVDTDPLAGAKVRLAGNAYSNLVEPGNTGRGNSAVLSSSCTPVNSKNTPLACASTTLASGDSREVGLVGSYVWTLPLRINIANETQQTLIMSSGKPSTPKSANKKAASPTADPNGPPGTAAENLLPADGSSAISIPGKSGNTVNSGSIGFLRTFDVNRTPVTMKWTTITPTKEVGDAAEAVTPKPFRTVIRLKALSLNSLAQVYQSASPKQRPEEWHATATADCVAGKPTVSGVAQDEFLKHCGDLPILVETDGKNLNDVRVASFDIKADWATPYSNLKPTGPAVSSNLCANGLKVESTGAQSVSSGPDGFIDLTLNIAKQTLPGAIKGGICNFSRNLS